MMVEDSSLFCVVALPVQGASLICVIKDSSVPCPPCSPQGKGIWGRGGDNQEVSFHISSPLTCQNLSLWPYPAARVTEMWMGAVSMCPAKDSFNQREDNGYWWQLAAISLYLKGLISLKSGDTDFSFQEVSLTYVVSCLRWQTALVRWLTISYGNLYIPNASLYSDEGRRF